MPENEERSGPAGRDRRKPGKQAGRGSGSSPRDGRGSFEPRAGSGRSGAGRDAGRHGSERGDSSSGAPRRDDRAGGYRRDDRDKRDEGPRRDGGYRRDDRGDRSRDEQRRGRPGSDRGRPGADRGRASGRDRHDARDRGDSVPDHNPSDLRSANRPDRAKSPEIDEDITGKELDRATSRELDSLDERNRPWVAKHLVMAGRLLEIDPQLSFEHALAASRRGGRLGCVREAVGLTAYAAGQYAEALREFRTYRRITGDNTHLPEMVDSERALGRHSKALELAGEVDPGTLDRAIRVELVMVLSGIHRDLGDIDSALKVLQVPELDRNRGFSFSPRLFRAYADALEGAGRDAEAKDWRNQARVAERALGIGEFADPEIVDFGVEEEARPERRPRARDLVPPGTAGEGTDGDEEPSATVGQGSAGVTPVPADQDVPGDEVDRDVQGTQPDADPRTAQDPQGD